MAERDIKDEAARQTAFDARRVRAFQELVETEGWKFFVELLNGRVGELTKDIFSRPLAGVDDIRGEAHDKGACYGLLWARDLPSITIAAFKQATSSSAQEENER